MYSNVNRNLINGIKTDKKCSIYIYFFIVNTYLVWMPPPIEI